MTFGTIGSNGLTKECVDGFSKFFVRVGGRDLGMCMHNVLISVVTLLVPLYVKPVCFILQELTSP